MERVIDPNAVSIVGLDRLVGQDRGTARVKLGIDRRGRRSCRRIN